MTSVKKLWLLLGILAVVLGGTSSLVAQDQLILHDAGLNNLFTGGSSQLNPRQINLTMETQNCPGQLCVFGLSTATGTGHLQSSGNYSITTPKGAPVMGGFAGPFFLTVQSDGHSIVTQTAPITFSYTSTQGTLTGSLTFTSVSATVGCCSTMLGTITPTGGSFAQFFPNGGSVSIVLGLSFPLQTFPAVPHAQSVLEFQSGTITANAPQLVLTCASGVAQVGVPYDSFLVATGGVPPYTYSIASGSLPPGLTLNPSTGEISGTPTMAGTFNYVAQAVDSIGDTVQTNCSIVVSPPGLVLTCASGTGQVGVPYDSFLTATGGVPPYTFSIISGSLPPGLTLNPSTGEISGTPTMAGTFNYTAQVTDSTGAHVSTACSITIQPPGLTLTCASGTAEVGVPYDSFLVATGGVPPYTFAIASGSLPPGLTLNPSTGEISGTPTMAGTFNYVAQVTDSTGAFIQTQCSIVVAPQLVLTCASGTGEVGVPYSSALVASGGTPPYTYSISSGSLPPGLTLNPSTGAITGTPTQSGTFNYTAKVTDSTGAMVTTNCSIVITPAPVLTCASGTAEVGVPYSSALVASGGTPPYVYSIVSGSLPPGLTLNPATGAITGTPTQAGTFNYTAQAVDSLGAVVQTNCSIVVTQLTLTCPIGAGMFEVPYSSSLVASGGTPPYTFSIVSGSLPPGLTLDPSTGAITGTPNQDGVFSFTAKVVDASGQSATTNCTITISGGRQQLAVFCASGTAEVGVPYSSSLTASGGTPPYTFSISAGSLPPGLTLDPSTGAITGTPTQAGTFNYVAKVVDSLGADATTACSITVAPALALTCASGTATVGVPYDSFLVASGGTPPYTYSIVSGSLPPGLTLNPSTGAITGTPTQAGTFNFTAKAVDSLGATVQTNCSIVVAPQLALTCPSGTATVGVPYDSFLVASGGTPPYTYSIVSGSLPPGLTLNPSTGEISGTPTTAGTYNFTAKAVDSLGATVQTNCSIVVAPPPTPSLSITKTSDSNGVPTNVVAPGMPIGFTVTVYSNGPANATNVVMSDPLPNPNGSGSGISWSIDNVTGGATCSISGTPPTQTLNCSIATLNVGSNFSVHVKSATTTASAGVYPNTATASATNVPPVQAFASITIVPTCSLNYPFGNPPSLSSVVFNESVDLVAAAACNSSGCGEPVAGPNDWVALFYTDEHAMTLGVRQIAVHTSSGTTTTNYPITPLTTDPGVAFNPQVGTTQLGDNLFFPNTSGHNPQGFPNDQAGTDTATWQSTYFYLDSSRPVWPALFITDITNNLNATNGDYQQGGMAATPPTAIFGAWKGAVRTVDHTSTPYAITVTPDSDPSQNGWNLGTGSDVPPGGFGQYQNQGYGTEARWNINQLTLNGQPLAVGHAYRVQIMVHDGDQNHTGGDVGEACLNVAIPGVPQLTLSCPTNQAFPNIPYSSQLLASGGTPPYAFAITSGSLPPGLTLNPSTGAITGTPTTDGTFAFTAQVTDSSSPANTVTIQCSITVAPVQPLTVSCAASSGQVGSPYTSAFVANGGVSPYTFSIASGTLPPGLTLNASTGALTGTPSSEGTFSFTIQVTDAEGTTATAQCAITITTCGSVLTSIMQNVTEGPAQVGEIAWFNSNFKLMGPPPTAPFQIYVTNGKITAGTSHLSVPDALITFSSSATCSATSFNTSLNRWETTIPLSKAPMADQIFAEGLAFQVPTGTNLMNASWTADVTSTVSGVTVTWQWGASNWFLTHGGTTFPNLSQSPFVPDYNGMMVQPSHNIMTCIGSPMGDNAGSPEFTGRMNLLTMGGTGNGGMNWTGNFSPMSMPINVCQPAGARPGQLVLSCPARIGTQNVPYISAFNGRGGTEPYIFSIASGSLPSDLYFNSSSGEISGTPVERGTFDFEAQAVDSASPPHISTATCSIAVGSAK